MIQGSDPADYRVWTAPDLPVAYSSVDYAENRDPVLAAAIAFRPAELPDLAALMEQAYELGGMEAALHAYGPAFTDARDHLVEVGVWEFDFRRNGSRGPEARMLRRR